VQPILMATVDLGMLPEDSVKGKHGKFEGLFPASTIGHTIGMGGARFLSMQT
jgi:hypothetical protein